METGLSEIDPRYLTAPRRTGCGWYSPRLNLMSVHDLDESMLAHELNHHTVHVATPYGAFHKGLNDLADRLTADYCRWMLDVAPDQPIMSPIYDFAVAVDAGAVEADAARCVVPVKGFVAPWSRLVELGSVFEGGFSIPDRRPTMFKAIGLLRMFEELWYSRAGRTYAAAPLNISQWDLKEGTASPVSALPAGGEVAVGAKHLIEGIACCVESEHAFLLDKAESIEDFVDYRLFWGWYIPMLIEADACDKARALQTRNTFLMLAYLALFVPAGPYFCELRGDALSWRDIHPGWRFLKAVKASIGLGLVENLQVDGLAFADEVCRSCGWPTVTDFFDYGIALPATTDLAAAVRLAFTHQKMAQAPHPDHSAVERLWNHYLRAYGPVIWIRDERCFVSWLDSGGKRDRFVCDAFISEWCNAVMLEGRPTADRVFPDEIPYGELLRKGGPSNAELCRLYTSESWMNSRYYREM